MPSLIRPRAVWRRRINDMEIRVRKAVHAGLAGLLARPPQPENVRDFFARECQILRENADIPAMPRPLREPCGADPMGRPLPELS
jgi:hypothetical protein